MGPRCTWRGVHGGRAAHVHISKLNHNSHARCAPSSLCARLFDFASLITGTMIDYDYVLMLVALVRIEITAQFKHVIYILSECTGQ